jgi:fructose-1-phosphate kinase PfkB-like protein
MKITILEFTPCADAIYHISRDAEEGYSAGDSRGVTIKSGAKLRPRLVTTYAGGKATNVARVMDNLIDSGDAVEVELVVFRPDSPEGRYIHDLQTLALSRVRVLPVIIEGGARLCVDMIDPLTDRENRVEFNISPRATWRNRAARAALDFASAVSTDLLLMAGNPPVVEPAGEMLGGLYRDVIERARERAGVISVDTEHALPDCLRARAHPDAIKINDKEFASVDGSLWGGFKGMLVVTDADGCRVWQDGLSDSPATVRGARTERLYSTIGAGDAMHAGFALARWVWGFDVIKAARYGQAAAAAAVSSPNGTRGISKQMVEHFFAQLETNH